MKNSHLQFVWRKFAGNPFEIIFKPYLLKEKKFLKCLDIVFFISSKEFCEFPSNRNVMWIFFYFIYKKIRIKIANPKESLMSQYLALN